MGTNITYLQTGCMKIPVYKRFTIYATIRHPVYEQGIARFFSLRNLRKLFGVREMKRHHRTPRDVRYRQRGSLHAIHEFHIETTWHGGRNRTPCWPPAMDGVRARQVEAILVVSPLLTPATASGLGMCPYVTTCRCPGVPSPPRSPPSPGAAASVHARSRAKALGN
jgi:hypothetical protein